MRTAWRPWTSRRERSRTPTGRVTRPGPWSGPAMTRSASASNGPAREALRGGYGSSTARTPRPQGSSSPPPTRRSRGGAGGRATRRAAATSGLILASADEALAREVRAQFKRRGVRKVYQAIVFGKPIQSSETWRDKLDVRRQSGRIRTAAGGGNLPAESRMTLVQSGSGGARISMIRLEPRTGRSHQLRVQCAKRGLPIVGDRTYGDFAANREFARRGGPRRMFLHSLGIGFEYKLGGREYALRRLVSERPRDPAIPRGLR